MSPIKFNIHKSFLNVKKTIKSYLRGIEPPLKGSCAKVTF